MDPILTALIAGATVAASEVAGEAVKDAYEALKAVLSDGYKIISTALLEKGPSNEAYQRAVEDELASNPAIANDPKVLEKAAAVHEALTRQPAEALEAAGVDIKELSAARDIIADRISGKIVGEKWTAGRDAILSNIGGKGNNSPGN